MMLQLTIKYFSKHKELINLVEDGILNWENKSCAQSKNAQYI